MRLVLLALLAGCGAGDTDLHAAPGAPSFDADVKRLFAGCIGCHAGPTPDGALDLSGDLYAALLETDSEQADLPLVEPGDAMYSYLFHKLNGSQGLAGGAGTRMPLGEPWPDEDIEAVATWIDLGAAP